MTDRPDILKRDIRAMLAEHPVLNEDEDLRADMPTFLGCKLCFMSWTYSAGLGALRLALRGLAASGRSRSASAIHSLDASSASIGRMCQFTMISDAPQPNVSMQMELPSMSFVVGSLASHSAPRLEDAALQSTYGQKCCGSLAPSSRRSSLPKTFRKRRSPMQLGTSIASATTRIIAVYRQMMRGRTIKDIVGGSLHTPTTKANFVAPSMQKWPSCRRFVEAFGGRAITPEQFEFLMGFPIGWTALEPSETP